jgi:DNA (cytosine-5)-methyltransferase 1
VVDLFAGAGGLSLGFQQAGYRVALGVDSLQAATRTYEANLAGAKALCCDVRKLSGKDILTLVGGEVHALIGGPSCQGFSTSGGLSRERGRDLFDPRNSLFTDYMRLVRELRPAWVLFENVPGMLLYHHGAVASTIITDFLEIGYEVAPIILLAADYGVPQLRRRLFFIGNRTSQPIFAPAATHGSSTLWRNYALPFAHLSRVGHTTTGDTEPHVTFDSACDDLPALAEAEAIDGVPYPREPSSAFQREMRQNSSSLRQHMAFRLSANDRLAARLLKPGENWRSLSPETLPRRFRSIRPYDATTMLRRLTGDRPAYTITTKFNEATTGAFIHPRDNRTLSVREAARLQSFPDEFLFLGSDSEIRFQVGNAVPPMLGRALAEALLPLIAHDVAGAALQPLRASIQLDYATQREMIGLRGARKHTKDYRRDTGQPGLYDGALAANDPAA